MKSKECLTDAYIMGIKTVGEAYHHVYRNAHLYFSDANMDMELAELDRCLKIYRDQDLIVDILTKQEMAKIDKQLEEEMK